MGNCVVHPQVCCGLLPIMYMMLGRLYSTLDQYLGVQCSIPDNCVFYFFYLSVVSVLMGRPIAVGEALLPY